MLIYQLGYEQKSRWWPQFVDVVSPHRHHNHHHDTCNLVWIRVLLYWTLSSISVFLFYIQINIQLNGRQEPIIHILFCSVFMNSCFMKLRKCLVNVKQIADKITFKGNTCDLLSVYFVFRKSYASIFLDRLYFRFDKWRKEITYIVIW
jgi:hypothetical protein